jgi:hypothetical protein
MAIVGLQHQSRPLDRYDQLFNSNPLRREKRMQSRRQIFLLLKEREENAAEMGHFDWLKLMMSHFPMTDVTP